MYKATSSRYIAILILVSGIGLLAYASWIPAKALLAQYLLQSAWAISLSEGTVNRPWSWADHWPVARLLMPKNDVDFIILEGDSGAVLAFAPGHNTNSGMPDDQRRIVISGHRDTHFRFLEYVEIGEVLTMETPKGKFQYRVVSTSIEDANVTKIDVTDQVNELLLVTCYPFNTPMAGGTLHYLVRLQKI